MKKYLIFLLVIFSIVFSYKTYTQSPCPKNHKVHTITSYYGGCEVTLTYCRDATSLKPTAIVLKLIEVRINEPLLCQPNIAGAAFWDWVDQTILKDNHQFPPCVEGQHETYFLLDKATCMRVDSYDPNPELIGDEYAQLVRGLVCPMDFAGVNMKDAMIA